MKSEIKELKEKNKALEKRIVDNQTRSVRDNLVFYNVKEDEKLTEEEKVDTEAVLVKFIKEGMKVKSEIRFERVHQMGKAKQGTDESTITPYNVGSVLWRLFSTLEAVQ